LEDPATTKSPAETRAKNRRRKLLREARRERAARKDRIFGKLVRGMPHNAIARQENCSVRAVRQIVARELANRRIDPAGDFAKLQIARLNDALMAANAKMLEGDMAGVDRLVKVVAELDRYHGLAQAAQRQESARPRALAGPQRPALPAPERSADEAAEGQICIASL
jgi:vacuolar-type H+-ATPase subunit H